MDNVSIITMAVTTTIHLIIATFQEYLKYLNAYLLNPTTALDNIIPTFQMKKQVQKD